MTKFTKFAVVAAFALMAFAGVKAYASVDVVAGAALHMGSSGQEVMDLQAALNAAGYVPALIVDGNFGAKTDAAVRWYQGANGLVVDGWAGVATAAALNGAAPAGCPAGLVCTPTAPVTCPAGYTCTPVGGGTGTLTGGAGSIDQADFVSEYSNEEVGEDQEDVVVAGLTIEADDGSDIEITAVTLDFDYADSGADDDLDEYAAEVSVWFDGEEVARVDAGDFYDDNDYSRTVSLDGAMIDAGEEGELTVAVSGISNLDSTNAGENWNVAFEAVRFVDADGATISDASTGDITDGNDDTTTDSGERQFSFESFATAADVELVVSLTDDQDDINEAHVIDIDDTDDTDGVEMLAFTLEVEGDSSVTVDEIPVIFTSVETTGNDPDDLVSSATLIYDGEEVGSENFLTSDGDGSTETITFDDLGLDLDEGEHEFIVTVDFFSIADTLDAGDTLKAEITATERAAIDAEDESGEDLASGDRTGTALGEASEVRDTGIVVELVGTPTAVKTVGNAEATQSDSGLFTITFDVTAFGANMYIDATAPDATGGTTESDLATTPAAGLGGTLLCTITSPTGATLSTSYLVEEDETERFAITCNVNDGAVDLADGFFDVALSNLAYATDDAQTTNIDYTFDLEDFKTPQIYLDDNGA